MQTLPLIHIFNKLSKSELNKLKRKLKHHLNRSDIKAIKKLIVDEGGVYFAEEQIKRLSNEAEKELDIFPDHDAQHRLRVHLVLDTYGAAPCISLMGCGASLMGS